MSSAARPPPDVALHLSPADAICLLAALRYWRDRVIASPVPPAVIRSIEGDIMRQLETLELPWRILRPLKRKSPLV